MTDKFFTDSQDYFYTGSKNLNSSGESSESENINNDNNDNNSDSLIDLYSVILFDLDGTLTDPKEGIVKSIKYALSKYGIEENDDTYLENFIGPSLFEAFKKYYSFSQAEVMNVVNLYREYYSSRGIYENKLYPGISSLLKSLNSKDKKLFVATSKPTVFAEKILNYFNLERYFLGIFGSNLDGSRVEKAEIVGDIMKSLKGIYEEDELKEKAVMVGDRKFDVIGARENEINCIGVLYGYGNRDEFLAYPPDYLVEGVDELTNLFLS